MTLRLDGELDAHASKSYRHWMPISDYFFAAQQPFLAAQQPFFLAPQPFLAAQQPFLAAQQPFFAAQQPFLPAQQPFFAAQQPFLPAQADTLAPQPVLPAQDAIAGTAAIAAAVTTEALIRFFSVLLRDVDFMYYSSWIS